MKLLLKRSFCLRRNRIPLLLLLLILLACMLAGTNRPIALAQVNTVINRIDLLCEIAGASLFGILLSKYDPVTCLQLAAGFMIWGLPLAVSDPSPCNLMMMMMTQNVMVVKKLLISETNHFYSSCLVLTDCSCFLLSY